MGCFVAPVTEAVVTKIVTKVVKSKERKAEEGNVSLNGENTDIELSTNVKIPFSRKLNWLSNMLWGGSALLAFEHLWHGEVVPWFPFLTAIGNKSDTIEMLKEISTVGVTMCATVTAVWGVMLLVVNKLEKKALNDQSVTR